MALIPQRLQDPASSERPCRRATMLSASFIRALQAWAGPSSMADSAGLARSPCTSRHRKNRAHRNTQMQSTTMSVIPYPSPVGRCILRSYSDNTVPTYHFNPNPPLAATQHAQARSHSTSPRHSGPVVYPRARCPPKRLSSLCPLRQSCADGF